MLKRKKVRNGLIIGVLALIAMGAVLWFVVLSPRIAVADELAAQTQQVEMNNLALHNQYNQTLADAQKASVAATEAQALFSKMPQEAELPQILQDITDAAARAGIKGVDLRALSTSVPQPISAPAGAGAGINLASMNIGITAIGTHKQVMAFLENLQVLERALLIVSTGLTAEGDKEVIQVDGSMFMLQSTLPDLVTTVDDLIKQAEAEGAIPTPSASASPGAGPAPSAGAPSAGTPSGVATPLPSASTSAGSVPAPLAPAATPTALPTAS